MLYSDFRSLVLVTIVTFVTGEESEAHLLVLQMKEIDAWKLNATPCLACIYIFRMHGLVEFLSLSLLVHVSNHRTSCFVFFGTWEFYIFRCENKEFL